MTNKNLISNAYLDKIINNYDMALKEQLHECKSFLEEFIICRDYFKPSNKQLKDLYININNLSNTIKTALELSIEKDNHKIINIAEGEIK